MVLSILHYVLCFKGMFQISWAKSVSQTFSILILSTLVYAVFFTTVMTIITVYLIDSGQVIKP